MIKRIYFKLLMVILLSILVTGCYQQVFLVDQVVLEEELDEEELDKPQFRELSITAVGDIMVHGPQLKAQFNPTTKDYDFRNNFKYVEPYFKSSDLVIGNLETTFGGGDLGYSSFPMFNTPDTLAVALKEAGFNVLSTANNHTLDTGKKGVIRTLEVLRANELIPVGTRSNEADKGYYVTEINGIRIGITALTYETPKWGEYRTLNAIKIPKDTEALIDSFGYENLQEDLLRLEERIQLMRQEEAEFIIVYIHWGNEYQRGANQYQKSIAKTLADFGVDIIFGSHPHVLQPIELIQSSFREEPTLVFYSLGNFLSNQRYEIISNRYTEDGIIVNVKLQKNMSTNAIKLQEVAYMPTWVHRFHRQGRVEYEILPLFDVFGKEEEYYLNNRDSKWRVENSLKNTDEIIRQSYDGLKPLNKNAPLVELQGEQF